MDKVIKKYTWEQFDKDIANLVRRIDYAKFKPKTIIGIAKGGLPAGVKLANILGVPLMVISAASYQGQERGSLAFNTSFVRPLESPVLIVDEIVDSGKTMSAIATYIASMGIVVKTASLFYKEDAIYKPNWVMNEAVESDWLVFPWE